MARKARKCFFIASFFEDQYYCSTLAKCEVIEPGFCQVEAMSVCWRAAIKDFCHKDRVDAVLKRFEVRLREAKNHPKLKRYDVEIHSGAILNLLTDMRLRITSQTKNSRGEYVYCYLYCKGTDYRDDY